MTKIKIELSLKKETSGQVLLTLKNRVIILKQCEELFLKENSECELEGELKRKGKKSNKQLAFYFMEIIPNATQGLIDCGYLGIDKDRAHEYLKSLFFVDIIEHDFKYIRIPRSLNTANKDELNKYVQDCIIFCETDLNCKIKTPEEFRNENK